MYLALTSYGNILQILPLFYLPLNRIGIFDEGYRYLKEIAKDGVTISLSKEEYESGESFKLIKNWRYDLPSFYREKYGGEAEKLILKLITIENDYFYSRSKCREPIDIVIDALKLRRIIFQHGFINRIDELFPKTHKQVLLKCFREMPSWF
ncbi:MAG: hypothetical protein HZB92_03295 [Euryarchaeota archaeon]|nr:hypothetical protein [Euryarchaeota archaeon]